MTKNISDTECVLITGDGSTALKPVTENSGSVAKKFDNEKPDLSLLPGCFKEAVAWPMVDGAIKYGRWNYLKTGSDGKGMDICRLIAAAERHLDALKRGEWFVPDSKTGKATHVGAVAANMLMISHLNSLGRLSDSRFIEGDELVKTKT